ncbi:ribosome-recycling factor [bacterium BMS3Abin15]|nr:ribosome-recycling factor [bacterium BMS3Abin15]HDH07426.1 ribosome recycling factor [Candidatus Moranbacteria bacterium]HDZ85731.1 ribosome recycling factor [Candidatus Moranbacteria bacterium]
MYKQIIESKKSDLEKAIEHLETEIGKLRTGRANPAMVEALMVDYYGTKTPLKQVASINVPEPRLIVVQPWDADSLVNIEAAIKESDLGLNPNNDGQVIRLNIPPLTEERRIDLVKVLNQKAEEARVSVRNAREEAWKEIQDTEKEGKISEDDKFRGKDELQKTTDEYNNKVEKIRDKKEKEIMTV